MARRGGAPKLLVALLRGFDTRQWAPAAALAAPTAPILTSWPSTARRRDFDGDNTEWRQQRRAIATTPPARSAATNTTPHPRHQPKTLKAALRLLYKRVHPDVMATARPIERDRNERSLKLLSEYLAAARCLTRGPGDDGDGDDDDDALLRSSPPSTHTLPFRFVFYVTEDVEDREEDGNESPSTLRKVELTLPPPERGRGRRGALSPAARRALRKLLGACGVPEPPPDAPDDERLRRSAFLDDDDDENSRFSNASRIIKGLEPGQGLGEWLPLAAEAARRGGAGGGSADAAVRVANLRGALRLSRGINVAFSPVLRRTLSAAKQAALLSALIRVLAREDAALAAEQEGETGDHDQSAQLDLRGLQVTFGGGGSGSGASSGTINGVDGAGTVWLDASEAAAIEASAAALPPSATAAQLAAAEDATEAWADLLSGLDPAHARDLRAAAEALRSLESSVARAMGVSAVVPGAGVAFGGEQRQNGGGGINPSYRAFLERLAAYASSTGPVQAPVSDVPLVVVAAAEGDDDDEANNSSTTTTTANAVAVPLAATPEQAYARLASQGPAAAERRRRAHRERAERSDRDERARRALGLRRLLRDPSLPPEKADRGVRALLRLRDDGRGGGGGGGNASLAACLEGLSVRVSDACRMPGAEGTDGSSDVVDVAWDAMG